MTSHTSPGSRGKPGSRAAPKKAKAPKKSDFKLVGSASSAAKALSLVRKRAGVSIRLFSRLTGFSERAIAGWEAGEPVSESARRRLLEVERFRARLSEVVKADEIPEWLDTPNEAFGGLKPVEVIERGEIDRLWGMIFYLESGVPT